MKKIYLLQHNTGEYEDSFTTTIAAYIDKDVRDKELERVNNENDNLLRSASSQICNKPLY